MRRRLFNALAAVSFALMLATVAVWARSYWMMDEFLVRSFNLPADPRCDWLSDSPKAVLYLNVQNSIHLTTGRITFAATTEERIGRAVNSLGETATKRKFDRLAHTPPDAWDHYRHLNGATDNAFYSARDQWSWHGFSRSHFGTPYRFKVPFQFPGLPRRAQQLVIVGSSPQLYESWTVPFWAIACLLAVLPSRWGLLFLREWRHSRRGPNVCRSCGYDLRGNPAATTCPECGAPRHADLSVAIAAACLSPDK
ncbi:MAG: hypothetical protein NTW19_21370 [Planctomycetota bacterium]|nr:hypothetical protein [Planctomycetota bacterium]